jgi:hypothetical protein
MDDRPQPGYAGAVRVAEPGGPADQVPAAACQAAAPAPSSDDARVGDVTLTADGELIEAGYGHGV